jgi:hypothetical protein
VSPEPGRAADVTLGIWARRTDGNRNIGVLQTTVGELVTVEEHQRKSQRASRRQMNGLTWQASTGIRGDASGVVHWVSLAGFKPSQEEGL